MNKNICQCGHMEQEHKIVSKVCKNVIKIVSKICADVIEIKNRYLKCKCERYQPIKERDNQLI